MRDSIEEFEKRDAQLLAIAPDSREQAQAYFQRNDIPFPCLADPDREVYRRYDVKSALVSLGTGIAGTILGQGRGGVK